MKEEKIIKFGKIFLSSFSFVFSVVSLFDIQEVISIYKGLWYWPSAVFALGFMIMGIYNIKYYKSIFVGFVILNVLHYFQYIRCSSKAFILFTFASVIIINLISLSLYLVSFYNKRKNNKTTLVVD